MPRKGRKNEIVAACTKSKAGRKSPRSVAGSGSASRRSTAGKAVRRPRRPGGTRATFAAPRKQQIEQLAADLTLDRHILQEIVRQKL